MFQLPLEYASVVKQDRMDIVRLKRVLLRLARYFHAEHHNIRITQL